MFSLIPRLSVQPEDYDRFMDMHDEIRWTFARSMPQTPHWYMVRHKKVSDEVYRLAFGVRRTWGLPGKFYGRVQLYLYHRDDPDIRYFSLDRFIDGSEIMNMAKDGKSYGVQDAPSTYVEGWAEYDEIGAYWDASYREMSAKDKATLWKLVHGNVEVGKPSMIDVGAGTGGSLEAQVAPSEKTVVIDPSQAMLNDLVLKYPAVGQVYPGTFADWADQSDSGRDLVVASLGSASYLSPEEVEAVPEFARHLSVLSFYREVPVHRRDLPRTHAAALETAMRLPHAQTVDVGNFTYVVVR